MVRHSHLQQKVERLICPGKRITCNGSWGWQPVAALVYVSAGQSLLLYYTFQAHTVKTFMSSRGHQAWCCYSWKAGWFGLLWWYLGCPSPQQVRKLLLSCLSPLRTISERFSPLLSSTSLCEGEWRKQHCLFPLHNYFLINFFSWCRGRKLIQGTKLSRNCQSLAVAFFGVPLLAVLQDLGMFVDDTKLTAGMLEGRDAIHSHLSGSPALRSGPMWTSQSSNKAKCNVLYLGWDNHQYQYRYWYTGWWRDQEQPCGEG